MAVTSCQVSGEKIGKEGVGGTWQAGWLKRGGGGGGGGGGAGKRKVLSSLMKYSVLSVVFHGPFPPRGWISRSFFRPLAGDWNILLNRLAVFIRAICNALAAV